MAQGDEIVRIQRQPGLVPAAQDMIDVHLAAGLAALTTAPTIAPQYGGPQVHPGGGTVEGVDAFSGTAVHDPIQALGHGAE